ncbi:MAG: hypothetical protein E7465_03470 [Ruminococcaceae bacterium]|nr:hypothetical protein [Oscillospiraceae bacterium]
MKRIICVMLSVCILLCLAACGKDSEPTAAPESTASAETQAPTQTQLPTEPPAPVETQASTEAAEPQKNEGSIRLLTVEKALHTYYEWADELPGALVRSEHSTVTLGGEDAETYPEMAQVLSQIAVMQENAMLEEFDNLVSFAREEQSWAGAGFEAYVSTLDVQVRRADSLVVSLLSDSYSHYGQIQYYRVYHGSNYDTQTGREILLNEVVDVNNDLALAVEQELLEQMYAEAFHSEYAVQNYFADTPYNGFSWTLDYTGVTFYFAPGQFCEGGSMTATVTFAEYPELFNEKYTEVPQQYAVEMPLDISFFADLNGDSQQEAISVSGCYDNERNCYLDFGVYTNQDGCWYEECYAHELHPYYVKAADGHYLYLFFEDFDEGMRGMHLMVLRLNDDGSVTKSGEANVSPAWLTDNRFLVPTDPSRLILDDMDSGTKSIAFSVGSGGIPIQ